MSKVENWDPFKDGRSYRIWKSLASHPNGLVIECKSESNANVLRYQLHMTRSALAKNFGMDYVNEVGLDYMWNYTVSVNGASVHICRREIDIEVYDRETGNPVDLGA